MGLTSQSTGRNASDKAFHRKKGEYLIALAGNPNVGKSTVFNALTGLDRHTGNWAGKTVTNGGGRFAHKGRRYLIADLPGTYSLLSRSAEETAARDFICFSRPDAVIVVCDASCIERNLNLLLQTLEITSRVVLCVNLLDEAEKRRVSVDLDGLSRLIGIPVAGVTARDNKGLDLLMDKVGEVIDKAPENPLVPAYDRDIETEVSRLARAVEPCVGDKLSPRWVALRLIDNDEKFTQSINSALDCDIGDAVFGTLNRIRERLIRRGYTAQGISDGMISGIIRLAEEVSRRTVTFGNDRCYERDRRIDRILTSRIFGVPIMLGALGIIFWLTIVGANYPSELLSKGLFFIGDRIEVFLGRINCSPVAADMAVNGVYRTTAWVVSVMLPPMAIFFPLFTLLEDSGILPRGAYNLDRLFRKANSCGKQALTMCMGFGCNAAGITGCRIIDSPRERLTAILTNNFVPCNGRFPALISLITMFFAAGSAVSAVMLLGVILAGAAVTLLVSWLLSVTVLRGVPSEFTLELPSYRRPQVGKVIVRSLTDRTVFVLGRACAAAAPAGLLIWLLGNVNLGGEPVLSVLSGFLQPAGRFMGLDGAILLGFILGFPANEIVIPIIMMIYTCSGRITEPDNLDALRMLFEQNGWTKVTALCMIIFMLFHFPCSTASLTVRKETGSTGAMIAAMVLPTAVGVILCSAAAALLG